MPDIIRVAGEAMFKALHNLPCRCEHNVLYAGMQTEQKVTRMCARCRSMAAWRLANGEKPEIQSARQEVAES